MLKAILKWTVLGLLALLLVVAATLRLRFGGGAPYPDLTAGKPLVPANSVQAFFSFPEPVGNVAATPATGEPTRVFFTVHPESRPEGAKLLEIGSDGHARPFPDATSQARLITPLGLFADRQHRLWVIDHGNHGLDGARLLAYDLRTNQLVHEFTFPTAVAERGSFFNDLCVSPDGRYVFVADVSFWRQTPSLVVYDVAHRRARSLLDGDSTVTAQNWLIRNPLKDMSFFGGLVNLKPGIDGIAADDNYVYYAPMAHSGLFRLPLAAVIDTALSPADLARQVHRVGRKPLSDGIAVDAAGNLLITDVEHRGLSLLSPAGQLRPLVRDSRIRWADGLSQGADGYIYFTDSAIPDQMLRSKAHIRAAGPYTIFRFRWPASPAASQ